MKYTSARSNSQLILLSLLFMACVSACISMSAVVDAEMRGMEAFRKRDFRAAERIFQELIGQNSESAHAWKLLGMTYAAEERYQQAQPPFQKACALNNREENACYYLARADFTLGRLEEALKFYDVALKAKAADRGRILLGIALTYEAALQPVASENYYHLAIEAGEGQAKVDYGLFLYKNGRGPESLALLTQAGATTEANRIRKALAAAPLTNPGPLAEASIISFASTPLPMIVRNGAIGDKHLIETMIAGVAVFDFDNDGWPDIFVANGGVIPGLWKASPAYSNRLFRNNQNGSFTDITEKSGVAGTGYSMGVATADFDNDGNVDLFVTGVNANTLYRNRGNGMFEDVTQKAGLSETGKWSVAAGWFDFDNDGLLDLFVVRYVVWDPAKEIFCGALPDSATGQRGYRQYCHPSYYLPLANALYRNLGGGRFQDVSREAGIGGILGKGMGVAFGDFDKDGRLDVFVANDTVPNFLFHNEGNGTFREVAVEAGVAYNDDGKPVSAMGADFRDYDNDGLEDLFVTALSNETFPLFRNMGDGHFADMTYQSGVGSASVAWTGWSTGMFDFNNDGRKDIFTTGGHVMDNAELSSSRSSRQRNRVFTNLGSGKFAAQSLPGEAFHRGAAFGDFDRDGRMDVVVTKLNEQPVVLRNTTASSNWIQIRLVGRKSNRDGIGARLHIVAVSGEQWNRVTTAVGYGCSSDRTVHFGLGKDAMVALMQIEWPSGKHQEIRDLAANRFYTIEEVN